jgi:hypothetical protein
MSNNSSQSNSHDSDPVFLEDPDSFVIAVEKILKAGKEKWPTEFNGLLSEVFKRLEVKSSDIFAPTAPTTTEIRKAKFNQKIDKERLALTLYRIQNASGSITIFINFPNTTLISRAVHLIHLDVNFHNNTAACLAGRFGLLPLFHDTRSTATSYTDFDNHFLEEVQWNDKKYTMSLLRVKRANQLANITGRGGATLFSTYFSPTDVENINVELWNSFVERLTLDTDLISWLRTINLSHNAVYP